MEGDETGQKAIKESGGGRTKAGLYVAEEEDGAAWDESGYRGHGSCESTRVRWSFGGGRSVFSGGRITSESLEAPAFNQFLRRLFGPLPVVHTGATLRSEALSFPQCGGLRQVGEPRVALHSLFHGDGVEAEARRHYNGYNIVEQD